MPSETGPNEQKETAAPESLDRQYERMLWGLNHYDALRAEADRRERELRAWDRILRSDALWAFVASRWKQ